MKKKAIAPIGVIVLLAPLFLIVGCAPNVGVEIQVSPESLDFGSTLDQGTLCVSKNYTSNAMDPFVVSADQPWLLPEACVDTAEACISRGPGDEVKVQVGIDRNKLDMGVNVGTLYVQSGALPVKTVSVTAEEIAKADFRAVPQRVKIGKPVQFQDMSLLSEASGDIKLWKWNFGDGGTSTLPNPQHTYSRGGAFTVSLTIITTGDIGRTMEKPGYVFIEAVDTDVDFEASKTNIVLGETLLFTDLSVNEAVSVLSRQWDFGDGASSSETAPRHTYAAPGIYTVTLSVTTAVGTSSATKENYIVVTAKNTAARLDFTFENNYVGENTTFFPLVLGDTEAASSYVWNFGDGVTSVEEMPRHRFPNKGEYPVELQYTDSNGTLILQKNVEVRYRPPQVLFAAQTTRQVRGEPIDFLDNTIEGYGSIVYWKWNFGDGYTSTEQNPTHTYSFLGEYDVTLEVTSFPDGQTSRLTRNRYIVITEEQSVEGEGELELDLAAYVRLPDECFTPEPAFRKQSVRIGNQVVATAYLTDDMVSQCWNPDDAVHPDYTRWTHAITIIEPLKAYKLSDSAMLFIDGGSRSSKAEINETVRDLAILTGTTVVHLKNVPSQPIVFNDEVVPTGQEDNYSNEPIILRERSEDSIIAYSYDKYLQSYRENDGAPTSGWPLLYPMVKSVVRAMDVAETVLAKEGIQVKDFVVAGASKRGWTTWLTGAVDSRITAIAPIVINILNMKPHLEHHRASYGYWSPAIYDYAQKGIFDQLITTGDEEQLTPEAQALLECVDPYQYVLRGRYKDMPKFMMNATGDEFFLPDTTQFYFDELPDVKHLNYLPNVGHGMGNWEESDITDSDNPVRGLVSWYLAVTQGIPLPEFSQTFEADGAIRVEVDAGNPPEAVRMWQATSVGKRDFRNGVLKAEWTPTELEETSPGIYRALPEEPPAGSYTGFFIQLEYRNPAQLPAPSELYNIETPDMVFTTGVRVLPVDENGNAVYPDFVGYLANAKKPDAVPFSDAVMPVIALYGSPFEMGRDYGELLKDEIGDFVNAFLDAYQENTGASNEALAARWENILPLIDTRILEEMEGISEGANISLDRLQMAHAAAMDGSQWNASSTMAYGELLKDHEGAAHAITVNNELGLNLAQYLCAILYIPDKGAPHTVLTCAGLAFGYTGINLGAISAAELPDPGTSGLSYAMPMMRTILYDAFSLRDAVSIAEEEPPLNTSLLFSDGRNESRGVRARTDEIGIIPPLRYDLAKDDFDISIPGIVYESQPDLLEDLKLELAAYIDTNNLTLKSLRDVANTEPFAITGKNILNVIYDGQPLDIYVSVADEANNKNAFETYRPNTPQKFNMQLLLP